MSSFLLAFGFLAAVPGETRLNALPATMKAVHKKGLGCFTPFSCIQLRSVSTPTPGPGQVLVAVEASSVNPCDVDYVEFGVGCGASTLGFDMAGTVVATGEGVTRLKIGDEVWADEGGTVGDTGAMAEYALVNEAQTSLKPSSLNFTEAATVPLVGLTSLECLKKTGAPWSKPNATVVITSGSGGTGFIAVQLAKALGAAHVATAASGAENIAFVRALGADIVVDYAQQEIFDALPDNSVDFVYDNYGAKGTADKAMRAIRPGGVYLLLPGGGGGSLSKHPKAGVSQINFGYTNSSGHAELDELAQLFDSGALRPHVFAQFPLTQAANAFATSKAGHVVGKVAVTIQEAVGGEA